MPGIAAATALVVCMVMAFAALGGVGQAGNAITMHTTSAVAAAMPGIFDELFNWAPSLVVLAHQLMHKDQDPTSEGAELNNSSKMPA